MFNFLECYAEKSLDDSAFYGEPYYILKSHTPHGDIYQRQISAVELKRRIQSENILCYNLKINEKTGRLNYQNPYDSETSANLRKTAITGLTNIFDLLTLEHPGFTCSINTTNNIRPLNLCDFHIDLKLYGLNTSIELIYTDSNMEWLLICPTKDINQSEPRKVKVLVEYSSDFVDVLNSILGIIEHMKNGNRKELTHYLSTFPTKSYSKLPHIF